MKPTKISKIVEVAETLAGWAQEAQEFLEVIREEHQKAQPKPGQTGKSHGDAKDEITLLREENASLKRKLGRALSSLRSFDDALAEHIHIHG